VGQAAIRNNATLGAAGRGANFVVPDLN